MSTETETINRNEIIFQLLRKECEQNEIGLNAVDELKTLLFMKRQMNQSIKDEENYIGSDAFHRTISTINSMKLRVITELTKI